MTRRILPRLRNQPFRFFLPAVVFFAGDAATCQQVVTEVGRGVTAFFGNVGTLDKGLVQRRENYLHVTEKGNALNVLQVVLNFLFPGHGIPAIDLGKPAQALPYGMAPALVGGHEHHIAHELRPRADYRHVALQYVEEFGEFVKASAAQELAVRGKAHVIGQQFSRSVTRISHGAELDEPEYLFVFAGAGLREERVSLHLDCTEECQSHEQRAQAADCRQGTEVFTQFAYISNLRPGSFDFATNVAPLRMTIGLFQEAGVHFKSI